MTDKRRPRTAPPDPGSNRDEEQQVPGRARGAAGTGGGAAEAARNKAERDLAGPAEAAGPTAEPAGQADEWQAKAKENYELFLRARADYENLARRTQREISLMVRLGKRDLLLKLLDLADNLERAAEAWRRSLAGCDGVDGDSLVDGVVMIGRQLQGVLAAEGVRPIEAVGCAFDPSLHECVVTWDSPEVKAEMVTDEIKRGYTHDGEVLRAAQVRVARPPR